MRQWTVLYRKEMLEMWRSGKWLWVPIVFILLGIMNPISSYYMPQIMEMAGNMPEGTVIQIPLPKAPEVLAETLSNYGTMGLLILVLASMGVVSSERASGAAAMILVKPVRYGSYISSKWAGLLTLAAVSYGAGYGASWYYTELLIGHVEPSRSLAGFGVYGVWLGFILTLVLFMSSWLRGSGAIAFLTLFLAAAISILTGLFSRYAEWSPGRLSGHASSFLVNGEGADGFLWALIVTMLAIVCLVAGAVQVFRRQELSE